MYSLRSGLIELTPLLWAKAIISARVRRAFYKQKSELNPAKLLNIDLIGNLGELYFAEEAIANNHPDVAAHIVANLYRHNPDLKKMGPDAPTIDCKSMIYKSRGKKHFAINQKSHFQFEGIDNFSYYALISSPGSRYGYASRLIPWDHVAAWGEPDQLNPEGIEQDQKSFGQLLTKFVPAYIPGATMEQIHALSKTATMFGQEELDAALPEARDWCLANIPELRKNDRHHFYKDGKQSLTNVDTIDWLGVFRETSAWGDFPKIVTAPLDS